MDLHIERPELNAQSVEENIAKIDTWIADTADKLNTMSTSKASTASTDSSGKAGTVVTKSEYKKQLAQGLHVGDYKVEATEVILEG